MERPPSLNLTGGCTNIDRSRYKAIAGGVIRESADMESEKAGKLKEGEEIDVTEVVVTESGTTRVHFDRGWASVRAKNGKALLERM
jgi:hypothetical protein